MTIVASKCRIAILFAVSAVVWNAPVNAHGFAGQRFFPAGLAVDDAFVADEADFIAANSAVPEGSTTDANDTSIAWDLSVELDQDLQVSIGNRFDRFTASGQARREGWDDFDVGTKYQVFIDPTAESAMSLELNAEI